MIVHKTLRFNSLEQDVLKRATLHRRIAFPGEEEARADKGLWREFPGRHLATIAGGDMYRPEQIHGAYVQARVLAQMLLLQSERSYWGQELHPRQSAGEAGKGLGTALVAPGTDICGMLAETRAQQLTDVQRALAVLEDACIQVGPTQTDEKYLDV